MKFEIKHRGRMLARHSLLYDPRGSGGILIYLHPRAAEDLAAWLLLAALAFAFIIGALA